MAAPSNDLVSGTPEPARPATELVTAAIGVSAASLVWSSAIGIVSIAAGVSAHSVALVGFGLESLIDGTASAVLVWRFRVERSDAVRAERVEHVAERSVAITLLAVAVFLTAESVRALVTGSRPEATPLGVVLTVASVLVLPGLAVMKLRLARRLPSPALRGDGILTAAGTALAATVLLALGLDRAVGWWWCDSVSALVISLALAWDARQTLGWWPHDLSP
jgi:divalent metal cation (Fe/Co/Zn/Cd) transporter